MTGSTPEPTTNNSSRGRLRSLASSGERALAAAFVLTVITVVVAVSGPSGGSGPTSTPGATSTDGVAIGPTPWSSLDPSALTPTKEPVGTPAITPVVPCAVHSSSTADPDLELTINGDLPLPGAENGQPAPRIDVPFGTPVELRLRDDVCATAWRIELRQDGTTAEVDAQPASLSVPRLVRQNRWTFYAIDGDWTLHATYEIQAGESLDRTRLLSGQSYDYPAVEIVAGEAIVQALRGCGGVHLANGYPPGDIGCGPVDLTDAPVLTVDVGFTVRLRIEGWTIDSWRAGCGAIVDEGSWLSFESDATCWGNEVVTGPLGIPEPIPDAAEFTVSAHDVLNTRLEAPYYVRFSSARP